MSFQCPSWLRPAMAMSVSLLGLGFSGGARAQATSPATTAAGGNTQLEEVIVTARKREESILNVPVIEQVVPQQQMQALQVVDLTDLPALVPGLDFGKSLLSIGTLVSIRGIGTASQDPGVDQSVSLNIDGLSLGNGLAFNSGLFDIGQVEVLKGPQALFFGKSSPGGVISIRTADPTEDYEIIGRGGQEFESNTQRGEIILSGPVTDTLKLRLAGMYQAGDGFFHNVAMALPDTGALTPTVTHAPDSTDSQVRLTALWDPFSQFTARLKMNFVHDSAINAETSQCTDAPTGTSVLPGAPPPPLPPFLAPNGCGPLNRNLQLVFLNPANFIYALNDGVPFLTTNQGYGTLDLEYRATPDINLTSVTGFYSLSSESLVNPYETQFAGPFLGINNHFHRREITEEVRATSDFKGPVNFTVGGLYEDGALTDNVMVLGNSAYGLAPLVEDGYQPIDIHTTSVFGQVRWDIIDRLELAAGNRWTDETRDQHPETGFDGGPVTPISVPISSIHSDRNSPEVTLTYRPTDDLTAFAAWKQGFKSGSFSIATPVTPGTNNAFGDETVRGGEAGLKSRWLDRQLAANLAFYDYDYSGLQVGTISPPKNGVPVIETLNAASAKTYGFDFDTAYRPAGVQGLQVNGSLEYNHGRYTLFNTAPCWGGQTIAMGCNQQFNPTAGAYTAQNLSNTPLIRAPEWQGNIGFSYEMPMNSEGYKLVFTNNNEISSRYVTFLAVDRPNNDNYQFGFAKINLGAEIHSPNGMWELALIGKDINNRITSGNCNSAPLLTQVIANPSGTAKPSPYGIDPSQCFADPGREVWLRLTVRPLAH